MTRGIDRAVFRARLIGGFELCAPDGALLLRNQHKSQALLTLLILRRGAVVPRERVAEVLWPGSEPEKRRLNLRQEIYKINRAVDGYGIAVLERDHETVRVLMASLEVDLWAEDGGYQLESLAEVCAGFGAIGEEFDEWLEGERRQVRAEQVAAIENQLQRDEITPEAALALAETLLGAEPENELAARAAMWGNWCLGKRTRAMKVFETLKAAVEGDGFEISRQTLDLLERIRTQEPQAAMRLDGPPKLAVLPISDFGGLVDGQAAHLGAMLTARLGRVREIVSRTADGAGPLGAREYQLGGSVLADGDEVHCQITVTGGAEGAVLLSLELARSGGSWIGQVDSLIHEIIARVLPALESAEAKAAEGALADESWYGHYVRAKSVLNTATGPEHAIEAEAHLRKALAKRADFAPAYPLLVSILNSRWRSIHPGAEYSEQRDEALELAKQALVLDARYPNALIAMTWVQIRRREFDRAEKFLTDAVAERPYEASRVNSVGSAFVILGDHRRAEEWFTRAAEITHHDMDYQYTDLAELHYFAGDYDEALSFLNIGQMRNPTYSRCLRAATLAQLDRLPEAYREAAAALESLEANWQADEPFSVEAATRWFINDFPMRREVDTRSLIDGLTKAGFRT